jgi:hypothetical protein
MFGAQLINDARISEVTKPLIGQKAHCTGDMA